MTKSRKFIVDKLVTDSSTAYELLNKYPRDYESEEVDYLIIFIEILSKVELDDYSDILLRFTKIQLQYLPLKDIDLKNKYDKLNSLPYNHPVWNRYKRVKQMSNFKQIYEEICRVAGKYP